jgi:hypothetical protein
LFSPALHRESCSAEKRPAQSARAPDRSRLGKLPHAAGSRPQRAARGAPLTAGASTERRNVDVSRPGVVAAQRGPARGCLRCLRCLGCAAVSRRTHRGWLSVCQWVVWCLTGRGRPRDGGILYQRRSPDALESSLASPWSRPLIAAPPERTYTPTSPALVAQPRPFLLRRRCCLSLSRALSLCTIYSSTIATQRSGTAGLGEPGTCSSMLTRHRALRPFTQSRPSNNVTASPWQPANVAPAPTLASPIQYLAESPR